MVESSGRSNWAPGDTALEIDPPRAVIAFRDRDALVRAGQNDFTNLEFKSDLRSVTGPGRLDKTVAECRNAPASGYPEERLAAPLQS